MIAAAHEGAGDLEEQAIVVVKEGVSGFGIFLDINGLGSDRWQIANSRTPLIYGTPVLGSPTCWRRDRAFNKLEPALSVLGRTLREADPSTQIKLIDLQGISTAKFLGALGAAGQARTVRAVVFIDASINGSILGRRGFPHL